MFAIAANYTARNFQLHPVITTNVITMERHNLVICNCTIQFHYLQQNKHSKTKQRKRRTSVISEFIRFVTRSDYKDHYMLQPHLQQEPF